MLDRFLIHDVEIWRPSGVNEYGKPGEPALVLTAKGRLEAKAGKEIFKDGINVISNYTLYLPPMDITEQDTVKNGGAAYNVAFVSPCLDGRGVHHLEVDLVKVD